jgi:hypothetical protein
MNGAPGFVVGDGFVERVEKKLLAAGWVGETDGLRLGLDECCGHPLQSSFQRRQKR